MMGCIIKAFSGLFFYGLTVSVPCKICGKSTKPMAPAGTADRCICTGIIENMNYLEVLNMSLAPGG
jgi:hypothetical protein